MNTAMAKEELEKILDQAVQDVTERTAGVQLHQGGQLPGEDLCTVQITFDKGFHTSLTLCADTRLLYRMACNSFHEEAVSPEDVEEFSKEYFNVLCGRIAGAMFRATQVPAHFGPPTFYHGRYEPEGREIQFVLTYSDECYGGAQLIHHVSPAEDTAAEPVEKGETALGSTGKDGENAPGTMEKDGEVDLEALKRDGKDSLESAGKAEEGVQVK